MAYSTLPIERVDLNSNTPISFEYVNGATTIDIPNFGPLGSQTFGSDGKRYVFAKAGAAIGASTATCSINASTFIASASGGTYVSGESMASGDFGWFAATSV